MKAELLFPVYGHKKPKRLLCSVLSAVLMSEAIAALFSKQFNHANVLQCRDGL